MLAVLPDFIEDNLKATLLIAGTVTAVIGAGTAVTKVTQNRLASLAQWIRSMIKEELKPLKDAVEGNRDENREVHKKIVAVLDDIHTATAELMPNGGSKLHDKIVDIAKYVEKLESRDQ